MDMVNPMDFSPVSYLDSIMNGKFTFPAWDGIQVLICCFSSSIRLHARIRIHGIDGSYP